MTTPPGKAVDDLMIAITTEKQDALASGVDGDPRIRQRLDAMVEAIGTIEALRGRLALVHAATASEAVVAPFQPRPPGRIRISEELAASIKRMLRR